MSPITDVNKPDLIKKRKKLGRPITTGSVRTTLSFTATKEEKLMLDELSEHLAGDSLPNRAATVCRLIAEGHKKVFGEDDATS